MQLWNADAVVPTGTLDPSPIPPPGLTLAEVGKTVSFDEIVRSAGMTAVVSTHAPPSVRVYAGTRDLRVPRPGRQVYCIGGATLPAAKQDRAKEIMRRLAYGYLDWAARETVARYHRDLRRPDTRSSVPQTLPEIVRVRRTIRSTSGISVGEIAANTGMAQPNVSRALAMLRASGEVVVEKRGRTTICRMAAQPS